LAGFSAAASAIVAATISILQGLNVLDVTEPVKIGLLGLAGAGLLAWAIAAAGDSLARAYAVANVSRTPSDQDNQPAIQAAAIRLADAYAAAHGVKVTPPASQAGGGASAPPASAYTPVSPAATKEIHLPISPPLKVKQGAQEGEAVAVQVSGDSGKETRSYLVGFPGSPPDWVPSDAIYIPSATPPATPPTTSPATQQSSTAASEECCLAFSPPIKVKVGTNDGEAIAVKTKSEGGKKTEWYLAGTAGSTYEWVIGHKVFMLPGAGTRQAGRRTLLRPAPPSLPIKSPGPLIAQHLRPKQAGVFDCRSARLL